MKLRIRGNSLRLRLERAEVATFAADGKISDRIVFGPENALAYGLEAAEVDAVSVHRSGDGVFVQVPRALASDWAGGDTVGFDAEIEAGGQGPLRVLVEKDFACLHKRPGEDESDAYPHPAAS
ncbi:MAG: hypothetical protein AAGN66_13160 [Acidobacteriota bacterium]